MNTHNATLRISAVTPKQYPGEGYPEFAFAGRSNVGKSSLINKLLNRKSLARVSGTPGKTVTINFYNIDDTIFLVDLPGYGYAQRSKTEIEKWGKMMEDYLANREPLVQTILLVDSRHKPTKDDITKKALAELSCATITTELLLLPQRLISLKRVKLRVISNRYGQP